MENNTETLINQFEFQTTYEVLAKNILVSIGLQSCKPFEFNNETLTIHVINSHVFSISKKGIVEGSTIAQFNAIERYYPMYKFVQIVKEIETKEPDFIMYWLD